MATESEKLTDLVKRKYRHGFVTDIEQETVPPGLSEDVIRLISAKKGEPEFLTEWRLKAYRHWLTMKEPEWAHVRYSPIDYQAISYYSAPKSDANAPKSLDEVDPKLLETYDKLGIPLHERARLAGVAVDAVFDSVSVATTFKDKLAAAGVIFCSFSEAVKNHPDLVRRYLGTVVPYRDNYFATLNSAVFTDGSFVYVPKGVRCPMELSTYFRINAANTGQFERTLIIADEGSHVSYLEGCTAPMRDENQLHAAVVELVALDDAQIKYSTVQNWYPGDEQGRGGIYNFVTKRGDCRGAAQDLVDASRDRSAIGKYPSCAARRQLGRRVLFRGRHEQLPAGRYGHEDDPHRPQHAQHDPVERHLRRSRPELVSRPRQDHADGAWRAQLHAVRLAAARSRVRRAHVSLHRVAQPLGARRARGDDVEDRRGPALLLPATRAFGRRRREHDRERLLP
jgi:Fe-S cluster assembly protein SufB